MFARHGVIPPTRLSRIERCVSSIAFALILAAAVIPAHAQGNFNSGSTGADGAFNPPNRFTLQIPESGVLNFTTITINGEFYIRANSRNTPVTMLASGDVVIKGRIYLGGGAGFNTRFGGFAGAGGFRGGNGGLGFDNLNGTAGEGPGGGTGGRPGSDSGGGGGGGGHAGGGGNGQRGQNPGQGGPSYGTRFLLPLIGGSGGGGTAGANNGFGGGGGGGGAVLIASSGSITFSGPGLEDNGVGEIHASGGGGTNGNGGWGGAGGSGGAFRLVANTIIGSPNLRVNGGAEGGGSGNGAQGYIRVEAFDLTRFTPSANNTLSQGQPNPVMLPNMPQLRIASIGGVAAPALPNGSFHALPDIVVPTSQPNPVTVAIEATNIPLGTVIQLTLTPDSGARTTINSTPLAGSEAVSNATASVTLPTTGLAVITASTTYNVVAASGKPMFIDGERIDRAEVAATFGGASQLTYITRSGKRIKM